MNFFDLVLQSIGFGPAKSLASSTGESGILYVGLLFVVAGLYRAIKKYRTEKMEIKREQMEFISEFFSNDANDENRIYKEMAFTHFFGSPLASHEIEFFRNFGDSIGSTNLYINSRHYFDFGPNDLCPKLKNRYENRYSFWIQRLLVNGMWATGVLFTYLIFMAILFSPDKFFENPKFIYISLMVHVTGILWTWLGFEASAKLTHAVLLNARIQSFKDNYLSPDRETSIENSGEKEPAKSQPTADKSANDTTSYPLITGLRDH